MPKAKPKLPKTFFKSGRQLKKFGRFLTQTEVQPEALARSSLRAAAVSALGGLLLSPALAPLPLHNLSQPQESGGVKPTPAEPAPDSPTHPGYQPQVLAQLLTNLLPIQPRPLTSPEEEQVVQVLNQNLPLRVAAELGGYRLNTNYGRIGAEQHLPRYPGDQAASHLNFIEAGITPRTGAWGFFALSGEKLTPDLVEKEKYYLAVQTFLSPNWSNSSLSTKEWFKYRKVLVVNPGSGQTVVAAVADAGPATWTSKQYGGSPEVMAALVAEKDVRPRAVLVFFLDDPTDKIPLGPVQTSEQGERGSYK